MTGPQSFVYLVFSPPSISKGVFFPFGQLDESPHIIEVLISIENIEDKY
jgi:hypothetical protein